MNAKTLAYISAFGFLFSGCADNTPDYAKFIASNTLMDQVDSMARAVVADGFNAGSIYGEVWSWFGSRMIMGLIENGFIAEAYDALQPMLSRAVENHGFYEWYTPAGEPMGSGTYRGEAGVLYKCNEMLRSWAVENR